jgi:hypothetical protein
MIFENQDFAAHPQPRSGLKRNRIKILHKIEGEGDTLPIAEKDQTVSIRVRPIQ